MSKIAVSTLLVATLAGWGLACTPAMQIVHRANVSCMNDALALGEMTVCRCALPGGEWPQGLRPRWLYDPWSMDVEPWWDDPFTVHVKALPHGEDTPQTITCVVRTDPVTYFRGHVNIFVQR
ncbi:hypothetical protein HRbin11_00846 [bacterium HR11]|nr:hypothetical protein HRbin11_00846 [bacterium HR11]